MSSKNNSEELVPNVEFKSEILSLVDREKIETPIYLLNKFLGGGVPLATIVEVYGAPKAGKSTFVYSTAGRFLKTFSNGRLIILDTEKSIEKIRMEMIGLDFSRIVAIKTTTLEEGFKNLMDVVAKFKENKDARIMVIWDSISNAPTASQVQSSRLNPGGMTEKPRLISTFMHNLAPELENGNISVWLISQVYTHFGYMGHTSLDSGGGLALKHAAHFRFMVEEGKEEYDGFIAKWKNSKVHITKTKFTPGAKDFILSIDIINGGVLDDTWSLLSTLINFNMLEGASTGWYNLPYGRKKYRFSDLYELVKNNDALKEYLANWFVYNIAKKSTYLSKIYKLIYAKDIKDEKWEDIWFEKVRANIKSELI